MHECPTPTKKQFTRAQAKVKQKQSPHLHRYRCGCGWYHLTSQSRAVRRAWYLYEEERRHG